MELDIQGKWTFITGASRGVGRQIALALAKRKCNLVLHARTVEALATLLTDCKKHGIQVHALAAELSDQNQVDLMLNQLLDLLQEPPHLLYNNAAIMTPWCQDWHAVSAQDYRQSFEVNTITPIRICHRLLPGMLKRGMGRVVNVTSGIQNEPELMAYAASKAALDKFVHDTVHKLRGTGVYMNLLDPGWLRTDLGGPHAPNAVDSVIPGALVPGLLTEEVQGELFRAQEYR